MHADTIVRRSFEMAGRKISYLTPDGLETGELLLLIHGAAVSARTWMHQLRGLAPRFRPVAIDLPGRRGSHSVPDPSLEAYADAACRTLEALGDGPAFVAGHSLGGAVAQVVALRQPERVKGLILMSTCEKLPPGDGTQHLLGFVPVPFRRVVYLSTLRKLLLAPSASGAAIGLTLDEVDGCPTRTIQHDMAIGRTMDLGDVARALRVPTLVLCGARDRLTAPELSRHLSASIAGSRLQIVAAAGHMLPLEAPDVVNHAIVEFASGLGVDAARGRSPRWRRLVERILAWRPR